MAKPGVIVIYLFLLFLLLLLLSFSRQAQAGGKLDKTRGSCCYFFVVLAVVVVSVLHFLVVGIKAMNNPRQDEPENIQNCSKERDSKIGKELLKTYKPFKSYLIGHFFLDQ